MFKLDSNEGSISVVLVIIFSLLISILLTVSFLTLENKISAERSVNKKIALSLAEAGVDKGLWELQNGNAGYTGETANASLTGGEFDVEITSGLGNEKFVKGIGYVPSRANPKLVKAVKVKISDNPTNDNFAFNYALQGGTGGINVGGSAEIIGNLYSNQNVVFTGSAHRVTGDVFANGTITPNPNSRVDGTMETGVPIVPLPEVDLEKWRDVAADGGTINGNYVPPAATTVLGPKEITGSMSMSSSGQILKLSGPLYVHGDVSLSGGEIKLDDVLGNSGTIVLVDGTVSISGGAKFTTNAGGGYILFISASTNSSAAITYSGSATTEALAMFAPLGGITLGGSGEIVAMCGQALNINGSGEIRYKTGLANANFSSGPGGNWVVREWQEVAPD